MQRLLRVFYISILKFTVVGSIGSFLVEASVLMIVHSLLGLNLRINGVGLN